MPPSASAKAPTLATPLSELPGVTPRVAEHMRGLGVKNLGQCIAYLPMRHERQEAETSIRDLAPGRIVSARGTVTATRVVRGRTPRFEAVLCDDTGRLDLVFFNQTYLRDRLFPGARLRVQGKSVRRGGGLQLANPRIEVLPESRDEPASRDSRLRPVYPASESITSARIEALLTRVLPLALPLIHDHFDAAFRTPRELPELREAYRALHAPADEAQADAARRRLAYDELFLLQLALQVKRSERERDGSAAPLRWSPQIDRHIRARLSFSLTPAQDQVVAEIAADLQRQTPAHRLIQGDVGSGKTAVALYAMLMAAASRAQAALMAPTELLAEQHHAAISGMLRGSRVRIELLTGSLPASTRRRVLAALAAGDVDLVIGTHALLTDDVTFKHLAVAVIDEQHRFGVHQRARLTSGGAAGSTGRRLVPHVLVMTATPIPRTLALTLLGDLDVSTIRGLPPGRKPVKTRVVGPEKAPEVYAWLNTRLDKGEQAYVVAPTIDPASTPDDPAADAPGSLASVRELKERLQKAQLAGRRLAVLHGQLSPESREAVMARFRSGHIDVLIATTVIEVGVDVPNASIMIIEHAERFGLAQLHQLRGRVGRGTRASACVLIADPATPDAQARLSAFADLSDGFRLAEKDLEIRGFGDVAGLRQSGMPPFRIADLSRDLELMALAKRDAKTWIMRSPSLSDSSETLLRRRLVKHHGAWLQLAGIS
ncbi:MAG: ATP-dependent DNA helicase RecG [Phycisphaerales bacterium]